MNLGNPAPFPAKGSFADGYERVAKVFARQIANGDEIGAGFTVYRRGKCVVDLWGGLADVETKRPWEQDTRIVLFSVTKGFAAMAFHLLADRGLVDWEAPVSQYWPDFGTNGKESITVGTLLGHRGGLPFLDIPLTMEDVTDSFKYPKVVEAMEAQKPAWVPETDQGYHALTFGMYARELFERVQGESMGTFLRREIFEPMQSDVMLGTPASEDHKFATLYPPKTPSRVLSMVSTAALIPNSTEAHVFREFLSRGSTMRQAFLNPSVPRGDLRHYNQPPMRRSELAWASATGSAAGVARAYLPFASSGVAGEKTFLRASTLEPAYRRLGWSDHDKVLQKPLGWSNGFLKEERHIFSPHPQAFGHAGMGGTLGWADPVEELAIGYALNCMDWHIRSPRCIALCHALYESDAIVEGA